MIGAAMRRRAETMPPTGAGLMRYFSEEGHGLKIPPKGVLFFTVGIIIFEILLRILDVGKLLFG
jgi:preprotein translocase subunit Sec61beta